MSCISEILKVKGDQEYLISTMKPDIAIEDGGEYKGYEYLITFTDRGHRCGYVALADNHPINKFDFMEISYQEIQSEYKSLHVHGEITFHDENRLSEFIKKDHVCSDKWIGFDAAHYQDTSDLKLVKKLWPKKDLTWDIKFKNDLQILGSSSRIRSKKYMINQCKKLIDQIVEIDNKIGKN